MPSLKDHLKTSVSLLAPVTTSDLDRADQKALKSCSLMKCHTLERGALMTTLSRTDVDVGMLALALDEDMLAVCVVQTDVVCVGWEGGLVKSDKNNNRRTERTKLIRPSRWVL